MSNVTNHQKTKVVRCAIYTRKSTEEGLEQDFNTLDAQRESAENYIASQRGEGRVQPESTGSVSNTLAQYPTRWRPRG